MSLTLQELLEKQLQLQRDSFGLDPPNMKGDVRAEFIRWNVLAAVNELCEMMNETGWKPWATSRHFNRELYLVEGVDVLHFLLNLFLVATTDGHEISERYKMKHAVNADRQTKGYTGVKKAV